MTCEECTFSFLPVVIRWLKFESKNLFAHYVTLVFIVASVIQRFSRVNWIGHRFKKKKKKKEKEEKIAEQGFDPWTSRLWAQHASVAPLCCVCSNRNKHLYNTHTNIVEAFKRVLFFIFRCSKCKLEINQIWKIFLHRLNEKEHAIETQLKWKHI